MPWINPIELLRLEKQDPEKINEEAIIQAWRRLQDEEEEKPISYRGKNLAQEQAMEAVRELDDPARARYYHRLCSYPEMNSFLSGDCFARVEEEALQDELITGPAAAQLQPAYDECLQLALSAGKASEYAAFVSQIEKGSVAFQDAVYQGKSMEFLEERLSAVRKLADRLEQGDKEEARATLGQSGFLREQVPVDILNALPSRFAGTREAFSETLVGMVEALEEQDPNLALAVARHTRRLRAGKQLRDRLNQDYRHLERRVENVTPASDGKPAQRWVPWVFAGILAVVLVVAGLFFNQIFQTALEVTSSLSSLTDTQQEEYSDEEQPEEALQKLSEKLAKDGSISREELDKILRESGNRTPLAGTDVLPLHWSERGHAYEGELSGEVEAGGAPLAVCFPPREVAASPVPVFTVIGDPVYDAVLFFFNGRKYFQQAFIPAKGKVEIGKNLDASQVVSTMIIFGQEWSPEAESPCGTPGYFTKNIFYGGFAAYATDPPTLNLNRDGFLQLKKKRLMPARQLKEEKFFDLLEQYR